MEHTINSKTMLVKHLMLFKLDLYKGNLDQMSFKKDLINKLNLIEKINSAGFECTDYSDSDLAKEHIRHMIGGEAKAAQNEVFYQIEFPERPNALGNFLTILDNRWNICLFHYRNTASDTGNVLIGFETESTATLEEALSEAKFKWHFVSDEPIIKTFLGS